MCTIYSQGQNQTRKIGRTLLQGALPWGEKHGQKQNGKKKEKKNQIIRWDGLAGIGKGLHLVEQRLETSQEKGLLIATQLHQEARQWALM